MTQGIHGLVGVHCCHIGGLCRSGTRQQLLKDPTCRRRTEPNPKAEINVQAVKAAVAAGKALIDEGKTKAEAAMAIFMQIEGESQDTVVKAFVQGATLTEKGALTYWYNCRRKLKKMRLLDQSKTMNP